MASGAVATDTLAVSILERSVAGISSDTLPLGVPTTSAKAVTTMIQKREFFMRPLDGAVGHVNTG